MTTYSDVLNAGNSLREYRIIGVLGRGSFAVTYLAQHKVLGHEVAIKEYFPQAWSMRATDSASVQANSAGQDCLASGLTQFDWGLQHFVREAKTLAQTQHPHVVPVRDYFCSHGTAYLVMDYAPGESFNDYFARVGRLSETQLRHWLAQLLSGLQAIHEQGFLHRDIKPCNVYLRQADQGLMLIDFGAARQLVCCTDPQVTSLLFSDGYAAPEQYQADSSHYGPWTDLYGVGALLYAVVSGVKPIPAPERQMGKALPLAREIACNRYSHQLLVCIDQALALTPAQRFQNVAEFNSTLQDMTLLKTASSVAKPEPVIANAVPSVMTSTAVIEAKRIPLWRRWSKASAAALLNLMALTPLAVELGELTPAEVSKSPQPIEQRKRGLVRYPLDEDSVVIKATMQVANNPKLAMPLTFTTPMEQAKKPEPVKTTAPTIETFQDTLKDDSRGPLMVILPSGTVQHMGQTKTIDDLVMGIYEVSFAEYDRFAKATGRRLPRDFGWGRGQRPVINVSWLDAQAYVDWLSAQTGQSYRLPTEAEWLYAALAGQSRAQIWRDSVAEICGYNVFDKTAYATKPSHAPYACTDQWVTTAPVGSFKANAFGLHDMLGNVAEWTCSRYSDMDARAGLRCGSSKKGHRSIRGGSWFAGAQHKLIDGRIKLWVSFSVDMLGFRVVREQAKQALEAQRMTSNML